MLKNIIILFALCTLGGCIQVKTNIETVIQLGDRNAQCVWVYLCGLTTDFNSAEEISTRKTLHELGQKLNIGFLAVIPPARCLEYGDKLCWPHNTDKEVLETYKQLIELTKNKKICGFIGFSNGGFFLNRLIQISKINIPIISIAAAGYLSNTDLPNSLYLVVGENDIHHYEAAQEFYTKSKNMPLKVTLIEHKDGHIIPWPIIEELLISFKDQA